jgi:WD40 repeat protein
VREFQVAKAGAITHLSFSPDGRLLAVASERSNTRLWDVSSAKPVRALAGTKGGDEVHFTGGGDVLTRAKGEVLLWPADRRKSHVVLGPSDYSNGIDLAVSPDTPRFVRFEPAYPKRRLTCRGLPAGDVLWQVEGPWKASPTLLFSPDGRHVANVVGGLVELLDAATGGLVRAWGEYDSRGQNYPPVAFRPDGLALACRWFTCVEVFRPETGDVLARLSPRRVRWSSACPLAFTPDGRFLVAVFPEKGDPDEEDDDDSDPEDKSYHLHFWDARTWQRRGVFSPSVGIVRGLAFSPDGMLAAVAGDGGKVILLDLVDLDTELLGRTS